MELQENDMLPGRYQSRHINQTK